MRRTLIALAALTCLAAPGYAGEAQVAVAANFTAPAQELAQRFEKKTGHKAVLSFGASGQFYAQIVNGAPFEVFLSADEARPTKAETEGYAAPGSRFTYAVGRLVLWSGDKKLVNGARTLSAGKFEKLAIADPATAPYGLAAQETMQSLNLWRSLTPKVVKGESIAQTLQFAKTGAAEVGFVALAQVVNDKSGSRWLVPSRLHKPIRQQAVLLKTGETDEAAKAFLAYLKSGEARATIKRYGYGLE